MADAASKVTIFFGAGGGDLGTPGQPGLPPTGWTETFYSGLSDLDSLMLVAQKYVDARRQLMGIGAFVQSIRLAKFPLVRATEVNFQLGAKGTSPFTNSPDDDYDVTSTDLLLRVEGANNARRQLWIAGLPDSVTDTLKDQGMKAAFLASPVFKQYVLQLIATQWGIRQHVRGSGKPGSFELQNILKVVPIMIRRRARGRPFYLFRGRRQ